VPPEAQEEVTQHFRHIAAGAVALSRLFENPIRTAGGALKTIVWRSVPIRDEHGGIVAILGAGQDVTEQKRAEHEHRELEQRMQQTQKLESLGVLASGIAHDFNNILTAILGNVDLALTDLSPVSPARNYLREVEKASRRAADLCRQMLAYSGKAKFVVEAIDLNALIEETAHMLEVSISKKTSLRYTLGRNLPLILGDATQMRQIIMNLVINASEAIGDRSGIISIVTGWMHCDRAYLVTLALSEDLAEGRYVFCEVTDTGSGMDKATLARIFDPFFTTKFSGRGLGLTAVLGIVRGHKGAIKVYSEADRGTTFRILVPAADATASGAGRNAAHDGSWRGSGTVLLADDEDGVRRVGCDMLTRLGFTVLTASDGVAALELFRAQGRTIACVILDLTMPRMDGKEAFRELRRLSADVPVLIASGYSEHELQQHFVGKGISGFLQKPYTLTMLRTVLQRILT
jgi:signal transduction histidine kinase